MKIDSASFETFEPPMLAHPGLEVGRTEEQILRKGGFSSALHYLRHSLMMFWVDYHRSGSTNESLALLRSRVAPLRDIYRLSERNTCRSQFDMEYGLAAVLTADQATIDTFLSNALPYDPNSDAYGFYTGFVGVIKGLLSGNRQIIQEQRQGIEKFNATKIFYWPSKAVIFATADDDYSKLISNVSRIEAKFTGYAMKMGALDLEGNIDLHKLDLHFFCPFPDLAFYALASRHRSGFLKKDSFWLPTALIEACSQQLVKHAAK